ncbi:MAG: type II toxin-antitoxin system RelE/ParE family toxin [Propionibacteriaceae bacterium]|nr:type II toxin-antitoxin system RelE/ParE family toxin [Propionibacteriaceae bacterium]
MAKVVLTAEAREDFFALDGQVKPIIAKALKKLETEPDKRGAPLGSRAGSDLTTFRKLVVGDRAYRIIYRVEANGTVTVVWVIGRRSDDECYRLAVDRLERYGEPVRAAMIRQLLEVAFETAGPDGGRENPG